MSARLACVSVDLDSPAHYCRIHGLDERLLDARARSLVHTLAIPRFLELLDAARLRATFFVIGEDARVAEHVEPLLGAHRAGVELASHSHAHDYAMTRLPEAALGADLARADAALETLTGARPEGFRAPGYTLNAALYRATEARGYRYGSSVFPAAPYYAAKALVMGGLALARRPSRAVLDSPRVLLAPRAPYWPDPAEPYRRGAGRVLELPITVAPRTRLPFIGTFAAVAPPGLTRSLYRACRGAAFFNFELHGIDLLDEQDGLPGALVERQRDLRLPWEGKRKRLASVLRWLREDYDVVRMAEAAETLAPRIPRA